MESERFEAFKRLYTKANDLFNEGSRSVRKALPDSRGMAIEFIDSGKGPYFIHLAVSGAAPRTGQGAEELFQVWEFDERGAPTGCREFTERADALEAAEIEE